MTDTTWTFEPSAVVEFCELTGAVSSLHRPDGTDRPIVPGMLTFLLFEHVSHQLLVPPFGLDVAFRAPVPLGSTLHYSVTADESAPQTWSLSAQIDGLTVAEGHLSPLRT